MNIGDTVFVWWYGKAVEGMIVENKEVSPVLASMLVVRIPIQGVHASALFMPKNVFGSREQLLLKHKEFIPAEAKHKQFELKVEAPAPVKVQPNEAYTRLQEFKLAHWDIEHNHIKIEAINDFYDLWVDYMCTRMGATKQSKNLKQMAMETPATPQEAMTAPKRVVSDTKMETLKQQLKTKLKPKKKHVTYTQLSLWD